MNGEIVTLIIYGSIALLLAVGGIYSLKMGFKLIAKGKGKKPEESSINFLGFKATTGSIGALVMITAFMWGWAAKLSLPQYDDGQTKITALTKELAEVSTQFDMLKVDHVETQSQLLKQKSQNDRYAAYAKTIENNILKLTRLLISNNNAVRSLSVIEKDTIQTLLKKQKTDLQKFKSNLNLIK